MALVISGLGKAFEVDRMAVQVLAGLNLEIASGQVACIVGESGCGKSTLLKIVAGLVRCDSGSVTLDGKLISGPDPGVGMVFQEHRLFPWLTVEENVALGLAHLPKRGRAHLVSGYLRLVSLEAFAGAYPNQLSGGMAQRAAIARSLVGNPKVLLLDEPFAALDALTRIQMQQEILRIWQENRTTMLLVTHDIDEAISLGDRVIVMSSRPGTIREIFDVHLPRPRDRTHARFAELKAAVYAYFAPKEARAPEGSA
jgi:sulfonate transport system ATP-binding protein